MSDVVVVGGGIVGLSIAWRCVRRGLDVRVHDAGGDGGAWYAAAGMLAPVGETSFGQEALTGLMLESARRWPGFAAELEKESGESLGYDGGGTLSVARTGDDLVAARRMWDFRVGLGLAVDELTGSALREAEPALSPRVRGGAFIPGDHQVDPRRVVGALRGLLADAIVPGRVEKVPLGRVVVAAGLGTAALTGLPVRPVKGVTLRLKGAPGLLRHVVNGYVDGRHVYLVPRADGEIVVGATSEERGDDTVTAGAVLDLLGPATELVPELAECEVTGAVVRHRPATPDNAPLLGMHTGGAPTGGAPIGGAPIGGAHPGGAHTGGVVVAAGHHRNGVLLAPVTADLIADLLVTGRSDPLLASFRPGRFA